MKAPCFPESPTPPDFLEVRKLFAFNMLVRGSARILGFTAIFITSPYLTVGDGGDSLGCEMTIVLEAIGEEFGAQNTALSSEVKSSLWKGSPDKVFPVLTFCINTEKPHSI